MSAGEIGSHPDIYLNAVSGKKGTGVPYHHEYPVAEYTYEDVYPFNWNAVPFVLPALKRALEPILSEDTLKDRIQWPSSYRRPKLLLAKTGFGFTLFLILLRTRAEIRRRRRAKDALG
jgi:hypothetical protein